MAREKKHIAPGAPPFNSHTPPDATQPPTPPPVGGTPPWRGWATQSPAEDGVGWGAALNAFTTIAIERKPLRGIVLHR